jgi:hypothetical protein
MAAIVLTGPPWLTPYRKTSVGTTLQEFTLPVNARTVTIQADAAAWMQTTGADGDATTATAKIPIAAGGSLTLTRGQSRLNWPTKVLIAADTGTVNVVVTCEGT